MTPAPAPTDTPDAPGAERLPPLRFGFLASGPWILGFVVCILFAFLCHGLAQWQWDRRVQVMHDVNRVLANYDDDPVPFAEASRLFTDFDSEDEWTPVTLTGRYETDETLVVRNRPRAGAPGYEVLVPFVTEEGVTVIVDRGWLPIGSQPGRPDAIPAPDPAAGEVVVRVKPGEPALDRDAPEGQVPSIDLAAIERILGRPIADTAYGLMVSESPAAATVPNQLVAPTLDEGPHLSYAIQWYIFAAMGFAVWGYSAWMKARNDRADALEDAEDDGLLAARRAPRPKARRRRRGGRPSDEEVEDALQEDVLRDRPGQASEIRSR
ncbi:SURF1 family protein [Micrococcus sp. ACRRV]|uniref:SURF1 family cytochrome oxidase biogenesis protein n=1 Tax=Micrococcus sp. ACRRV TaxID=2918203 RepID=UPI001EF2FDF8|nr:SURF1 family protein [Micrococcus sp. ACRRV]MCG7423047.1 SURF1 family protein [Micrococcus sp. ACRRV]